MRPLPILACLAVATALTPAFAAEPQRQPGSLSPALAAAMKPVESYRPLPLAGTQARLSGEVDTRVVPVYLLPSEAARPARFQVTYMSAVSVMPEGSRITIAVNDAVIGERQIRATSKPESLVFDVPAGMLENGFNAVRITVRQAHRVDCSRDASYELWTQILPEQSGFVIAGPAAEIRDLRDLPALRPSTAGTARIRVRAAANEDPAALSRHARAVQAAVVLGRYSRPVVDTALEDSGEPGLDVLVGVDTSLAPLLGSMPAGAGPRVFVQHDLQSERVNLVVTGATENEVEAALRSLEGSAAGAPRPLGTAAGLRSLSADSGLRVEGGETLSLAQLGFGTQRFAGRYYHQAGLLQMPADFYPGDYGRIVLNLDAAYAPDLLPASRINVRVNGAVVSTLSLQKRAGDTLTKRAAFLPLSAFKPGANSVEIEAETLAASDSECSPTAVMQQRDRFLLAQTSELVVPPLARIGMFPSLSGIMAGSVTAGLDGKPQQIYLPRPTPELVDSALTLLAKIASVSGRVSPVGFTFERPEERRGHTITLGALNDVPPAVLAAAGLDGEALLRAWRAPEKESEPRVSTAPTDPSPPSLANPTATDRAAGWTSAHAAPRRQIAMSGDELGGVLATDERGSGTLALPGEPDGLLLRATRTFEDARDALRSALPFEFNRTGLEAPHSHIEKLVTEASSLVVAQGASARDLGRAWNPLPDVASTTVIVAPTPELLQASLSDLVTSQLWQQLAGATAAFDRAQGQVRSAGSDTQSFVPTQSLSVGNVRLIAASWLSQNVGVYIGVMALIALLLTALTYRLVRQNGVDA